MNFEELNYQRQNLEIQKQILLCSIEFEGMKAENVLREIKGESPAYAEDQFGALANRLLDYVQRASV